MIEAAPDVYSALQTLACNARWPVVNERVIPAALRFSRTEGVSTEVHMNRTESYRETRSNFMRDVDTWVGNSFAFILSGLAVASGVIGMLVAFEYINEGNVNPFEDGMVWLVAALVLGLCANAFRREHHVVDPKDYTGR